MMKKNCAFLLVVAIFFSNATLTPLFAQKWVDEKYFSSLTWRLVGPFRGGRSCAVTGVLHNPDLYYMASTGGGVWKTEDSGETWTNISDGFFGGSMGAIAVSMADENIIFAGEGEETVRGNMSPGRGIWKSEDGGKNWTHVGLKNSYHIVRIRCHPKNADIVWVAVLGNVFTPSTERGIYKTIDGGKTWKRVLYANDRAGAIDLCLDPNNPRVLFASTWNVQRTPYSLTSGGEGSALWKSSDGGETWHNISKHEGLPQGIWGKVCVAVAPSHSETVYAMIENENGGLFRSSDGGKTWLLVNRDRNLRQRAWYFSRVAVDPKDENIVYVQNVGLHKSNDGGNTFKAVNTQHADHHDMWIDPNDSQRIIVANDGGAQITRDGGRKWSTLNNQPTAQFYRVTTDDHFPFRIYAAQQDNTTIRILHRTTSNRIDDTHWEPTAGGESGHIAVDPLDSEIVYGGSYGGYLSRYDHRLKLNRNVSVWPDNPLGHGAEQLKYRFQWNFPIFFSPHNPRRLYAASNYLHVTESEGQRWETISPDLTRNDASKLKASGGPITKDNTSVEYYCTIFAACESPRVKDLLWVGSDDGLVHVSFDGGKGWKNVTPPQLPPWAMINSLEADPHRDGGCYLAATLYKSGNFQPYLFKTNDYGKTWVSIINGIPSNYFTRVIRADPVEMGLLFAGTEYGVFFSMDDGMHWRSLQLNLPIVPITDLTIKDDCLIAATQGRSIWMIDDLSILRQLKQNTTVFKQKLFQSKPAYRMEGSQLKPGKTYGTNHAPGLIGQFYIDSIAANDTVRLIVLDKWRDTVNVLSNHPVFGQLEMKVKTGSNTVSVPMVYKEAVKVEGAVLWWANTSGPVALPGKYVMYLVSKYGTDSVMLEWRKDPLYPVTEQDIERQFLFLKQVRDKLDQAHRAILEIRDVKSQLQDVLQRIPKDALTDTLFKLSIVMDSLMNAVENELHQPRSKSYQDPINFPIKLNNKLAHLNALYHNGSYPPTDQAEDFRKEITSLIDVQLDRWKSFKAEELYRFNTLYRELGLPVLKPKAIR